jgi:hypothetical protein
MNNVGNAVAYFITWTTYGTWLPGDKRGWVKKGYSGIQPPDWQIEDMARERMIEEAVALTTSQRSIVENTIQAHCDIRKWKMHAANARTNHVHVVVTADRDPDTVMDQLKAWCSRKLSDAAGLKIPVAAKQADAIGLLRMVIKRSSMTKIISAARFGT